jgi:hypothetical protein
LCREDIRKLPQKVSTSHLRFLVSANPFFKRVYKRKEIRRGLLNIKREGVGIVAKKRKKQCFVCSIEKMSSVL